jgi:hypothetical protein
VVQLEMLRGPDITCYSLKILQKAYKNQPKGTALTLAPGRISMAKWEWRKAKK